MLDISVFDRLRNGHWWRAPIVATTYSASLDTTIFWSI
ncbi:membrane protein, partial [Xanthomonas oryzae pv. oryzae]